MNSIDWLEGQILNLMSFDTIDFRKEFREKFVQAKEMHKQEVMNGFNQGYRDGWIDGISVCCNNDQDVETFDNANLYYKETFKTNK